MVGEVVSYVGLGSADAAGSGAFFAAVFGWALKPMGNAGDGWFDAGPIRVGLHGGDPDHGAVPYFRVVDLDAAAARVLSAGGILEGVGADEPGFGCLLNCRDPAGCASACINRSIMGEPSSAGHLIFAHDRPGHLLPA